MKKISRLGLTLFTLLAIVFTQLPIGVVADFAPTAHALTAAERAQLQAELAQLEEEIKQQESLLKQQEKETGALSSEVKKLANEISAKKRAIQNKNREIANISSEIKVREQTIAQLDQKIARQQASLAQLLRKQYQLDSFTLFEIVLSDKDISEFLVDLDDFAFVKRSLKESFEEIRHTQALKSDERAKLQEQRDAEADAKAELDAERRRVQAQENDQRYLLAQSQSKEKNYEQIIADRKKEAASIRARLFTFQNDTKIPFGQAYEYAKNASRATGVRTAFILATLAQETGYREGTFGRNVGQCYLRDEVTGAGVTKSGTPKEKVMKPSRDVQPFKVITARLGRDWQSTPISCPLSYGWGGAMGHAQFIASTWEYYADDIARKMGVSAANPWNAEHAIMAAAVFLGDLGADKGTYTAEKHASCRYYSGRDCNAPVPNLFYANSVQKHAKGIQADIDLLESL